MPREEGFIYRSDLNKICRISKWGMIVMLILMLILMLICLIPGFSLTGLNPAVIITLITVGIFALTGFIMALAFYLYYGSKRNKVGGFEEIDVFAEEIIYNSEKTGKMIIQAWKIKEIVTMPISRGSSMVYMDINFVDSGEVLRVPNGVAKYRQLMNKINVFAKRNSVTVLWGKDARAKSR